MEYPTLQKMHVNILVNNTKLSGSRKEIQKLPAIVCEAESRHTAVKPNQQSLRHFAHSVETTP